MLYLKDSSLRALNGQFDKTNEEIESELGQKKERKERWSIEVKIFDLLTLRHFDQTRLKINEMNKAVTEKKKSVASSF